MRIELIKDERGRNVGYKIIAETSADTPDIEQVRDLHFWGFGDTKIVYDGRKSEDDSDTTVELRFIQKGEKGK
jgi:predicted N-acetyltransferase YhbS